MAAGAYEAGADAALQANRDGAVCNTAFPRIRALTPSDATAALDRLLAEAVEMEREACAMVVAQGWCVPPNTRKTFDPDLAQSICDLIRNRGENP